MEEITFEAHGPSGIALIIETLTDKRTRTVPNLRAILKRHKCVPPLFDYALT